MKNLATILCGLLLLNVGCGGPLVMIPGGKLSGTVQPVPSDWAFSDEFEDVQLETRPSNPYSVNIWGVADWAKHIEADPNVRLRIGEDLYELRAVRTDDPQDRVRFLAAVKKKYDGFEPDEEQAAESVLYSLESR
jgi:hypothetical protein